MGTTFNNGDKPKNRITISRGGETAARKIDPEARTTDRSFAQPNPALPVEDVKSEQPATAQDEADVLRNNSKKGRDYKTDEAE